MVPTVRRGSALLQAVVLALLSACGAKVQTIEITPGTASVATGTVQQFAALATYSDKTKLDVTSAVTWKSSDTNVASFLEETKGAAKGQHSGSANITAVFQGIVGAASLTVTDATQTALAVTPSTSVLAAGTSQQLQASATFSDGSVQDVTSSVTWTSSSASVTVDNAGLAQAVSAGTSTVTATLGGLTATVQITVTNATLSSLSITPASPALHAGQTLQLTATGTFSDGSTQDLTSGATWTSSASTIAAFTGAKGLVTGVAAGSATVTATVGSVSAQASVSVSDPVVTTVAVTPSVASLAQGTSAAFTAKATLSDGSMQDVTATATWTSSDGVNAPVDATGHVQGVAVGTYTVTATFSGVSGSATVSVTTATLVSMAISPTEVTLPIGSMQALHVVGTFTDATTQDLTSSAVWTSDDLTVAAFQPDFVGTVRGVAVGSTIVRATLSGVVATATVSVTAAQYASLALSPSFTTLALGTSVALYATATLTDGSTTDVTGSVAWTADASGAVSVTAEGVVQALVLGDGEITATLGSLSATASVTVTNATLVMVALSPENASVAAGATLQLSALGTFSDGSTQDLTSSAGWTSTDATLLTVSVGLVRGVSQGTASVTATLMGVSGSVGVTVTPAVVQSLAISPALSSLALGTGEQLTATATYSDGSTQDVTGSAQWEAVTSDGITVSDTGYVQSASVGSFVIGASFSGVSAVAQVAVTTAELTSLAISPADASIPVGLTKTFTVVGTFSDGSTQDVTSGATWSSSDPAVADFRSGSVAGVLSGLSVGTITVTASLMGVSTQVSLTVTSAQPAALHIDPPFVSLALGTSQQLTATVTLTDGSMQNVTASATWVASNGVSVTTGGLVSATAQGDATVTATFGGQSATTFVTVTGATLQEIALAPATSTLPVGATVRLTATGIYTDNTTFNLSSSATWSSSDPTVATVVDGAVTAVGSGSAVISAAQGAVIGTATVSVTDAVLTSIAITPAAPVTPVGTPVTFSATGTYSDGSTIDVSSQVTWTSSDAAVASFADETSGDAVAHATGTATITATIGSVSATATLHVTDAVLASLTVSPSSLALAAGTRAQLTVSGTFTDGSVRDLSSVATWSSTETSAASVSNAPGQYGLVTAVGVGSSLVMATVGGVSSTPVLVTVSNAQLVSLTVEPSNVVTPVGVPVSFSVIGAFTDGSEQDLTGQVSWTTSPSGIATFGAPGSALASRATGVAAGSTTVTATLGGISGTATLNVSSATLTGLALSPAGATLAKGLSQQFTATGSYSDSTTADVTTLVSWSSSASTVAAVSNAQGSRGLVTALAVGSASLTVSLQGTTSDSVTVDVTPAALTSIAVSPAYAAIPKGLSETYGATGTYTDGTQTDITSAATWTISDDTVGALSVNGSSVSVQAGSSGSTTVTATIGSVSGTASFTAVAPTLLSVEIDPESATIVNGRSQSFVLVGNYSDSTSVDLTSSATWTSSNESVAKVSAGVATAVANSGTSVVHAAYGAFSVDVTVTAASAVLESLTLEPSSAVVPNGLTQALVATAAYSDGSSADVTSSVNWSSASASVATVSSSGVVKGKSVGQTTITASITNSESAVVAASVTVTVVSPLLSSISVAPTSSTIAAGTSLRFTATGLYTDGSSQNITSLVTWASDSASATISNVVGSVGLAQGVSAGSAVISAALSGVTGATTLTVSSANLVSIEIAPNAPVLANGTSVQMSATGTYSNGTTQDLSAQVSWSVSGDALTIDSDGLLSAVSVGSGVVTAALSGVTATTTATVTSATLSSISVSPATSTLAKGTTVQLTATGTYSDGTTQNISSLVTWTAADTAVATVSSRGLATAVATGTTQLTATLNAVSGSASITVSSATLTSLAVTPASGALAKGTTKALTATGTYSDGTAQDLTGQATWSSSDTAVATVSNAPGSKGVVTGAAPGAVQITATVAGVSGAADLNVTSAVLTAVSVSPAVQQIANGTSFQFTATGLYSDGSSQDETSRVTWSSSDASIATVSNAAASRGLAHGVAVGSVTLTASLNGFSGTASLTVSSATLASIAVSPAAPVIANGTSVQLTATGTYSDGTSQNLTGQVVWSSSSGATVFSGATAGLLQATSVGTSTITATLSSVSGVATVTVTDATLTALSVEPVEPTLASGTSLHLAATGTYSDGSTQDVTSLVAWSSSASTVAAVSNATGSRGLVSAGSQGTATITATLNGISAGTDVTVTNAVLQSIAIAPASGSLPKGTTLAFTATGTYSDGTQQDLTTQVTWSTSDVSVAAVSTAVGSEGVVTAIAEGQSDLIATFSGVSQTVTVTVTPPVLRAISVSPGASSIAAGTTVSLTATGIYSDNSSQDLTSSVAWSSANETLATVSNGPASHGVVLGVSVGSVVVTATVGTISGNVSVTVSAATLSSLAITPTVLVLANGTSVQLTATGTFSDGSVQDLTGAVTWSSDSASLGFSDTTAGLLLALSVGSGNVSATLNGQTATAPATVTDASLVAISVSPTDPTIAAGTSVQMSAAGTYSDGTTQDITSLVTWSTSDGTLASVSNTTGSRGVVSGLSAGTATITATLGAISDSSDVSVTDATLESLVVAPTVVVLAAGTTQSLVATGVYSDGSQQDLTAEVVWSSSDGSIASVSTSAGTAGLVTAIAQGTAQITATLGTFSASGSVTVTNATLQSLEVTPATATIAKGTTQQFFATGTYSDGNTQDVTTSVTWSSSNTGIAQVSNASGSRGLATGSAVGTANIIATLSGVTASGSLTISGAVLSSIAITPANRTIATNSTVQMAASGIYSDGTTQDLTSLATWSSSVTAVATVSNTAGTKGLATGRTAGTVTISASFSGITGTTPLTVSTTNLSSITVTPQSARLGVGTTFALSALGTYSDGTTQSLTTVATWTSSSNNTASVSSTGVVTAKAAGTVTITAAFGGRSGTSSITVTTATLSSVVVTPSNKSYAGGVSVQFKATGIYSDNSSLDLTSSATWSSDNAAIAAVSSSGLVSTSSVGTTNIRASVGGKNGVTKVTVTNATLSSVVVTPAKVKLAKTTKATLTATAKFSDGSTLDVTSLVAWTSSDTGVATVSGNTVTGVAAGTATVTGTWSGASGTSAVTVTNATLSSISLGSSTNLPRYFYKQLKATGTFSDGTTQDVTELATWSANRTNYLTVSNVPGSKGLVYGVNSSIFQSTRVTATVGSVSGNVNVTVTTYALQSISITAQTGSSLTAPAGYASHLKATGSFRSTWGQTTTLDITTQVTWSTSDSNTATSSGAGAIAALMPGTVTVRAAYGAVTGTATMTVSSATLSSLTVSTTSGPASVSVGASITLKAVGGFSDGSQLDISGESNWSSADSTKATVIGGFPATVTGVAATSSVGVSATAGGLTKTLNVAVN